jgi:hypothetical protein
MLEARRRKGEKIKTSSMKITDESRSNHHAIHIHTAVSMMTTSRMKIEKKERERKMFMKN